MPTCKIQIDRRHPSVTKFVVSCTRPAFRASLSLALVKQNMISYALQYSNAYHPHRTSSSGSRCTRCPVHQVPCCALFQSPLAAMLGVEGVVAGFTAFVARWRTQMAKYGSEKLLSTTLEKKIPRCSNVYISCLLAVKQYAHEFQQVFNHTHLRSLPLQAIFQ